MVDCVFCKVINQEIPAKIIYEDEFVAAFDDISPKAPLHKLVVPKQHIPTLNDLTTENAHLVAKMVMAAKTIAQEAGIAEEGYRIIMNCQEGGGQSVFHIHLHLLGGRVMNWPPG